MLEHEIDNLRERLTKLLESDADYSEIYKLSVELDELIVRYYNEKAKACRT